MNALVVDNYETSLYLTAALLSARGVDVFMADTPKSALKLFMRNQFDLVIIRCALDNSINSELIATMRELEVLAFRAPAEIIATVRQLTPRLRGLHSLHGASLSLEHPLTNAEIIEATLKARIKHVAGLHSDSKY